MARLEVSSPAAAAGVGVHVETPRGFELSRSRIASIPAPPVLDSPSLTPAVRGIAVIRHSDRGSIALANLCSTCDQQSQGLGIGICCPPFGLMVHRCLRRRFDKYYACGAPALGSLGQLGDTDARDLLKARDQGHDLRRHVAGLYSASGLEYLRSEE